MDFHAYLLRCSDGSYYAGHTDNLEQRMGQHQTGILGGYTARRRPVTLVWSERFPTRDEAFAAERKLKGWSRAKKEALIAGDWALVSELARNRQGDRERGASILRQAQDERGRRVDSVELATPDKEITARGELILSLSKGEPPVATPAKYSITRAAHAAILAAAATAAPNEACGLLLGTAAHIETAKAAANVHPEPLRHFEIDPAELIAAHKAVRDGGPKVIGYFHSHPNGLPRPSATDAASASGDGRIWAIAAAGAVTLWCDAPSGFEPLSYGIKEG
ncbi:Mov34/MPN/PAD-1 family protein [Novosphingobium sp.]|uniref:Mov34/MPN/PAD-1 family protein n=1 Tax=Novosphingobium sp. TaxID=1874826 RepID=UPI003BA8D37B